MNDTQELDPGNGITYGYRGGDQTIIQAMTAFAAISWATAIELIILIFLVFKKYSGVYFWSLLISTISIIPYAIGAWIKQVSLPYTVPTLLPVAFLNISWMVLIPGQSVVLWSRLHLITQNQQLLRFILWLIIVDWFVFCIPTTVFTWGSNTHMGAFVEGYTIFEKIQMTAFSVQEVFISGVYVWEVRKMLQLIYEKESRRIMWELLSINVFIIVLDVALLTVEFLNMYQVETTFKGMVYSIKLKLEFGVLGKLVKVALDRKGSHARIASQEAISIDLDGYNPAPRTQAPGRNFEADLAETRKPSAQYIENAAQRFNFPKARRHSHFDHHQNHGRQVKKLPKKDVAPPRPTLASRFSEGSGITIQYPGRLDNAVV
ncbi:hypothetical protein JX265_012213 [Neoarthrinium moseri]|uniref:DUF7703 domain-containing protein n=1 Tax=Neoarthrinium moseri TaxID=1658444 RepID=A0A9Q0AK05_9PEZI|nr:hypothetical protein JX265_012213 [Neoarthrinium moseri]